MMKKMPIDVQHILHSGTELIDRTLDRLLPAPETVPSSIHRAMRHTVFAGGKRLRPILCMEAARMVASKQTDTQDVLGHGNLPVGVEELGAAIEMLHTYSLVHDDLPALDNDDLRRGRPTCHVAFGEAIAILAGDALQTQAYEVLSNLQCPTSATVTIVREIARATGTVEGMIGGQVLDLEGEGQVPTAAMVEAIHRAKTGALITTSLVCGGIYAGAAYEDLEHLRTFGKKAGLAFQIIDDVLDVTQSSEQLGKTAGKDTATVKATWPAVYGVEKSLADAARLITDAFTELQCFGPSAETLKALANYLVERKK
jgi:geranylgeranyl diphosphate synthase type II